MHITLNIPFNIKILLGPVHYKSLSFEMVRSMKKSNFQGFELELCNQKYFENDTHDTVTKGLVVGSHVKVHPLFHHCSEIRLIWNIFNHLTLLFVYWHLSASFFFKMRDRSNNYPTAFNLQTEIPQTGDIVELKYFFFE